MRKVLRRVDDARLGRALAGLAMRVLSVEDVVRRDNEVCVLVRSSGKTGVREFGVCIRGQQVSCSCSDFRKRGVHCKHIALVALHELAEAAQARRRAPGCAGAAAPVVGLRPFFWSPVMM